MKTWPLIIGILVILALLCSPVLAISKSDLISQYQKGAYSGQTPPTSIPTSHTPSWYITPTPTPVWGPIIPVPTPVSTPIPIPVGSISVISDPAGALVYLDGSYKGDTPITISGVPAKSLTDVTDWSKAYSSYIGSGKHQIKLTNRGYQDYITTVTVEAGQITSVIITLTPVSVTKTSADGNFNEWKGYLINKLINETKAEDSYETITFEDSTSKSGKPNIYLYSNRDLTARVQLTPEKAIIVSEPVYQLGKGWRAEIRNGSLNGIGDFLFYEAVVPDSVWQKERGYVIRAAYREQDMASMLGRYGFNEKETAEFIDYWASHLLENVDYEFSPQETGAVERVMSLSISPEPDHVMRIWFYAEPLVSAPEPVISPEKIVREGFYVVEWGVVIKDKYRIYSSPSCPEGVVV